MTTAGEHPGTTAHGGAPTAHGTGRLDIVILGVPKAGTSSLYAALAAHPEIVGSNPKETCCLLDRTDPLSGSAGPTLWQDGRKAIETYFPDQRGLRLEATTLNLYSETARQFLLDETSAKLLVSLRAPAERIYSNFRFVRDHQCALDDAVDFPAYVDALLADKTEGLRKACRTESGFIALTEATDRSNYLKWLKPWSSAHAQGRLRLVLFEAFRSDPLQVLMELADWLGVDARFFEDFTAIQANKTVPVKLRTLHRWIQKIEPRLPAPFRGPALKRLYRRIQGSGQGEQRMSDGDAAAIARLRGHFRAMSVELADTYAIDVDSWWSDRSPGDQPATQ